MESVDSKNDCETFCLNLRIFFSAGVKVRNEKAIGLSAPLSFLWDKTAPIPYGDASQASISFLWEQNKQGQILRLNKNRF